MSDVAEQVAESLRQAILTAAPGDTVEFGAAVSCTIRLSDTLLVAKSLTITDPSRDRLTVNGLNHQSK